MKRGFSWTTSAAAEAERFAPRRGSDDPPRSRTKRVREDASAFEALGWQPKAPRFDGVRDLGDVGAGTPEQERDAVVRDAQGPVEGVGDLADAVASGLEGARQGRVRVGAGRVRGPGDLGGGSFRPSSKAAIVSAPRCSPCSGAPAISVAVNPANCRASAMRSCERARARARRGAALPADDARRRRLARHVGPHRSAA
jgi:hypothetical protein